MVHYNVRALLKEKTPQLPMRTTLVTFNIITISHKLSTSELWCDFCKRVDPSPGSLRFKSQINFSCIAIKYFSLIHFYCKAKSAINYLNSPWWPACTKYQVSATQPSTKYLNSPWWPSFSILRSWNTDPVYTPVELSTRYLKSRKHVKMITIALVLLMFHIKPDPCVSR